MKILFLALLLALALAKDNPNYDRLFHDTPRQQLKQQQFWFSQVLDHYNYDSKTTQLWNQRYWVYNDYFNPRVGPVFLFICG